jgi:phosphatidylglycerol:prolipoprotein diacylglycerol transferase
VLPEIHILGLTLQSFGLMLALALVSSGVLVARRLRELGKPVDWAYEMMFFAGVGGIAGAKVWYTIEKGDSGGLFSGTGLVFYGGAIGGALAVLAWASRRGMLNAALFDMGAPALAIGYAVGRLGCQLAGDGDYGIPSNLPWAMAYPDGTVPTTVEVHPTPIYEFLVMGLLTWWLWRRRDRVRPGSLFALWALLSGIERFLIEFIRRNDDVVGIFSTAQLVSLLFIAAGATWLARERLAPSESRARRPARA